MTTDHGTDHGGGPPRSGLRDPVRAARGLGAGTLVIEAVVLLLAVAPLRMLGGGRTGAAIAAVLALTVLAVVLAGLMRHGWAWYAGGVLQGLVIAAGLLHWSLAVMGLVFGLVWAYVWHVRRTILRAP